MSNVALAVVRGGSAGSPEEEAPLKGRTSISRRERLHIRRALLALAPMLVHMSAQVLDSAYGPDPESGIVFLDMLIEECAVVRRATTPHR